MTEIKFVELNCQRCGGALEQNGDTYTCQNCGKKWRVETMHDFNEMLNVFEEANRRQRVEDIANLRQLLWKEVNQEYVSNLKVSEYCTDILKWLPQDFYAEFYRSTCSNNKRALGDFLLSVNAEEHADDIALVLDYLLKSLKSEWIMGVSNFIEKIKDVDMSLYHKYRTMFENEYQNIEDGVFEASLERDVFIAYSSADMPKVMELVAALEEEGLLCFVAARNMRHGSGSVENYREFLHTAINNCRVFVFVSSGNSRSFNCDAYKEEIKYIGEHRKNMPRVEYLIQNYSGKAVERNFKNFFSGLEYCVSVQDVVERVADIIMNLDSEPDFSQEEIERQNRELQQQIEEERRKAQELEAKIAQAERARAEAEANARAEQERRQREQAETERKRREEEERRRREQAEAAQRAEQERQRKLQEEQERKRREEEERKRRAEAERRQREQAEARVRAEQERRRMEEAAKNPLSKGDYRDLGNGYVAFGMYPQSKKAGSVQIYTMLDKERGYYLGSDNSLYAEWKGEYYKVEPIKWKVLKSGSEQFIVSDIILDAHRYDGSNNNYANSEIRSWLNGEFYKKAFTEAQRNLILTTKVDNSVSSTGDSTNQYVCENTNDKIFLLSRKEAEQYLNSNEARKRVPTEYAVARGAYQYSDNNNSYKLNGKGCGWWWLRSPFYNDSNYAQSVFNDGVIDDWYSVDYSTGGVVCALKINVQTSGQAEAAQRAEQERQRKLQEEQERKRREEEERKRRAEAERRQREQAEARARAEQERRRMEEAAKNPLSKGDYRDLGNCYVAFGMYPQSKKAGSVQIYTMLDTERGYYLGSDNNLYAEWNGEYYKVEPIKWKVLKSGSEQFIVSDIILDAHRFDENSNNYANSEIRSWLNDEFYKKAFTEAQRNLILTTKVDNSVSSTGNSTNQYVCGNTNDKILLLSHKEAEKYFGAEARKKKGTDYAKARGLWVNSNNGNSWWWLRSPCYNDSDYAQRVCHNGDFDWSIVNYTGLGVFPALKFKVQSERQSQNSGDFEIKNGVLVKYKGNGGNVVIPDGVREIGEQTFMFCSNLTNITIPNSVTSIGDFAFTNCSSLKSVIIPNNVTSIGDDAFAMCELLTSIIIPKSVTYVGIGVFASCESLKTIYCEAASQPSGWNTIWNFQCNAKVVWGYKG